MDQQPWLIAGLGNPGSQYEHNWHNMGFMALEILSQRHKLPVTRIRFKGLTAQGSLADQKVILLKPTTYMNLSGESIREALAFFKIPPQRCLVLFDDLDIPVGQIRIRPSGGPGTHNGMRSIVSCLGTEDFPRIRIGIGPLPEHWELVRYVLSDVSQDRQETVWQSLCKAADTVELIVSTGLEPAMNRMNRKA